MSETNNGVLRKVVAGCFVSLDGVAEAPQRFMSTWDDDMDASSAALIATQDTVILGRRTFDEWAAFWPTNETEPFAAFINSVPKHVATSTPLTVDWRDSHVINGALDEFVRSLKGLPGGSIGVHGSISVTQSLLAADLVDELSLIIAPAVAGTGKRLFDTLPQIQLETIRSITSPSGYLLVDYRVVRQ